jgi:UDP-glucose 4-epimerase
MMKNKNLKCLVTGGNGYIGSHMCRFLAEQEHQVSVLDNFSTSPKVPTHSYGQFFEIDLLNQQSLDKVLFEIKPDVVFHFAGSALVGESEENPLLYYYNNFQGSLNLTNACVNVGTRKFIFSSSCATYGNPSSSAHIDETTEQNPTNAYGRSKLLVEHLLYDLGRLKKIDSVALRYFNVGGCHPDGSLGENHDPETHLIPNLVKSFLGKSDRPFYILGDEHKTLDGTCIRDFIHVLDLVEAHYKALEFLENKNGYHSFNLGSGKGYSVKEVMNTFEKIIGKKLNSQVVKARAGDPPCLVANIKKATEILSFCPKLNLEDCIIHTLSFFQKT